MMPAREELVRSFDGTALYRCLDVPKACEGMVLLLHGLGDHCRRYDETARLLCEAGWGFCRYDHRGHGRSGGARAYLEDFHLLFEDAAFMVEALLAEFPSKPLFTWGYSMGGFVAAGYGISRPGTLAGQVFFGACAQSLPLYKNFRRIDLDKAGFNLAPSVGSALLARDPRVGEDYDRDPCVLHAFSNKLLHEVFIRGVDWLVPELYKHRIPALILHGADDRLVPVESSRQLYERSASHDKTFEVLPGLYHDLLHEQSRREIVARAVRWMNERS